MADGIEVTETDAHQFLSEATMENQRLRAENVVLKTQNGILTNCLPMTDKQWKQFWTGFVELAERLKRE